mmetsp:Transcript_84291/g.217059  ORF Transcript_84291/g.217059 Transcript_84291/m.217059 type:complete len:322 (+) Transcript_84291:649-1614(+)
MSAFSCITSFISCGMKWGHWPVMRLPRCASMSHATNTASFRSSTATEGWISFWTSGMHCDSSCAMNSSGWPCISAPWISQQATRRSSSSSSSSPWGSSSSAASAPAFAWVFFSSSLRTKEALMAAIATWPMCLTWSADRTPLPAFFRQAVTPSARVFSASASTGPGAVASSAGRMRFRNSWTSCVSTWPWPLSRAAEHSSPQVSKARSRISSPMEKSKTGSSACAVCATNGAYILPSSSTNVFTHSMAFCRSSISEVLMTITFILPSSPFISVRLTSSSSSMPCRVSVVSSLGARVNFSRMPGRMCGTKGRKSPFMVKQMR